MNKYEDLFSKIKVRKFPNKNYHAIWHNLKTIRLGEGVALELDPDRSEFYDVGINTLCNAECPFCYVSATGKGINFPNICETWNKWMSTFPEDTIAGKVIRTHKPFQIAIGSTGEPTIHPQFNEFLETVYNSGVVPNYTTNGLTLYDCGTRQARRLLETTAKYVGGVAVSYGNPILRDRASRAIHNLLALGDCKVNIHHIISDKESVDAFAKLQKDYGKSIYYHVLLPLMPSGRSKEGVTEGTWEYLEDVITDNDMQNVSFGAHFINQLEKSSKIKTWLYPAESLSKNIILAKDCVKITPSSFNLKPIIEIKL